MMPFSIGGRGRYHGSGEGSLVYSEVQLIEAEAWRRQRVRRGSCDAQ